MTSRPKNPSVSRGPLDACLVILALWSLAVAQPLFDLLGRTTAFFVAHRADRTDLVLFALLVSLLGPAVVALIVLILRRLGRSGRAMETVVLSLLAAPVAAYWLSGWAAPGWWIVFLALVAGGLAALTLNRWSPADTLARWLGAAAWIFPLLFLLVSPARQIGAGPESETKAPAETAPLEPRAAVLLVLDEFPLVSLLDEHELIDAGRFPNFVALAETATWYRNATTVAQSTAYAVPAILSGRYPEPDKVSQPVWSDYKKNIFTALDERANMHVVETMSQLCPSRLCSDGAHVLPRRIRLTAMVKDASAVYLHLVTPMEWRNRLPEIGETWRDFWSTPQESQESGRSKAHQQDSAAVFDRFVEQLSAFPAPALHYLHLMTPHLPWQRLPDGTRYGARKRMPHGLEHQAWRGSRWETVQAHQRHLLQVGWVDLLIGRLREALEDLDSWDDAIVIVTSDHGTSFEAGGRRRNLTPTNFPQIVNVPLFVKYPGQTAGSIDDSNAETIDVMPTLLAALGAPPVSNASGSDLAGGGRRESKTVYYSGLRGGRPGRGETFSVERVLERRLALARKIERFGSGTWDSLFAAGPFSDLVGAALSEIRGSDKPPTGPWVHLDRREDFSAVDLRQEMLPVHITGSLRRAPKDEALTLAVAVNGIVQATTETFLEGKRWRFSALVPKSSLVSGENSVDVLRVSGPLGDRRVRRLKDNTRDDDVTDPSE